MKRYKIAGITLDFEYCFDDYFEERLKKYENNNQTSEYQMIVTVNDKITDNRKLVNEVITHKTKRQLVTTSGDFVKAIMYDGNDSEIKAMYIYTKDYKSVEIFLKNDKDVREREYVITSMMFMNMAIEKGYLPIHASSIIHNGVGIAFSAPSTTGKSTHANLWKQVYGDVKYINDDKPLIIIDGDKIKIAGSPWSGKTNLNLNAEVELKAILFLEQSLENRVVELSDREKITHLLRNVHRPNEERLMEIVLKNLNDLIIKIKIGLLQCNITAEAVKTAHEYIFER